jgi:transcriptional regulator with XRE-family HTH domain
MLQFKRFDEGMRTRILRVAAGLSQHDLASRAGIDRRRLSEHERGERTLPATELARVYTALDDAPPQRAEGQIGAVA